LNLEPASIVLTGASGFIGSALAVELQRHWRVVAIDRREHSPALKRATPNAEWHDCDIADQSKLAEIFNDAGRRSSELIVVHFAAFYHFDLDAHPEYARTNVAGTENIVNAALAAKAKLLIFASSLAAVEIPQNGEPVHESSPIGGIIPYAWSKAQGEAIVAKQAAKLPCALLRIGAVFSDWAELPFLHSLIQLWGANGLMSRIIPGAGRTALPFIHRDDLAALVLKIIECRKTLDACETLLASQHGSVSHHEIYARICQIRGIARKPLYVPKLLARNGLRLQRLFGLLTGNVPYERPWMLDYLDRPMIADTSYTRGKIGWDCRAEYGLLQRLPLILQNYQTKPDEWIERNRRRTTRDYRY